MSTSTLPQPVIPSTQSKSPTASLQIIPLAKILPSKTNPRKSFDGPEFDELVASVREHGVLQPVLVRPAPHVHSKACFDDPGPAHGSPQIICNVVCDSSFELVAGERRFRAAKAAGLSAIQASVRELTDEQALEVQVIENMQRKDVTALEEADGFRNLRDLLLKANPKATHSGLVQTIAQRIGKSVRYVWARLKLNELIPELQEDLRAGHISASHADELVRLCAKDQEEFLNNHLFENTWGDVDQTHKSAKSVRHIKEQISRNYQLDLAKPGFPIDSATLVPAAGACTTCLKNSINSALASDAEKKKPTCMDRACFAKKREAFVAIEALKSKDKASKPELVTVTTQHDLGRSYRDDKDKPKTRAEWKTAHAKECEFVQPAVVMDVSGLHGQAVGAKLVCTNKKCAVHFGAKPTPATSRRSSPSSSSAPSVKKLTAAELEKEKQLQIENERDEFARVALFQELLNNIGFDVKTLDFLIKEELRCCDETEEAAAAIAEYFGFDSAKSPAYGYVEAQYAKHGSKLQAVQKLRLLFALRISEQLDSFGERDLNGTAKFFGLNPDAIRSAAIAKMKARQEGLAKKSDPTPEQLASIADPKAPKKSKVPSPTKAAASPKTKTTKKAAKKSSARKSAKKSSTKKGGR
jgi:ParB/RepB/Spo0J family partition protein